MGAHDAGWRNPKHRAQWRSTLATYAFPHFGDLPAGDVGTGHVMAALEPIWTAKPETATRVRGRIEAVLDYATARGQRAGRATRPGGVAISQNLLPARGKGGTSGTPRRAAVAADRRLHGRAGEARGGQRGCAGAALRHPDRGSVWRSHGRAVDGNRPRRSGLDCPRRAHESWAGTSSAIDSTAFWTFYGMGPSCA